MPGVTITQPDVTLLLDLDGIIREVTLSDGFPADGLDAWLGQPWVDTVAESGGEKIRLMLQDARASGVSGYRMVMQRFPSGLEVPVEYSAIRLGSKGGGGKAGLIAIGRNQQTVTELQNRLVAVQQAREQDYWKLREVETRYRLLFDTSSEAVLVIRADGFRVIEANLAALRALNLTPGQDLLPELNASEHAGFMTMLSRVRDQGRAPGIVVHIGAFQNAWSMRASLMAVEPDKVFLLQLTPLQPELATRGMVGAGVAQPQRGAPLSQPAEDLMERLPDAFVVVDHNGAICRANAAFLDLIEVGTEAAVMGERLGRWLSRPGADMGVLLATVLKHRTVRMFATSLQGDLGSELDVEISACGDADGQPRFIGLLIRDVSRRIAQRAPSGLDPSLNMREGDTLLAALGTMADHLGQTSLPTLVKETVGLVEKYYIEAALERADGNRTATAELLGLSRQSLYMKLNRYGLDTESLAAAEANR